MVASFDDVKADYRQLDGGVLTMTADGLEKALKTVVTLCTIIIAVLQLVERIVENGDK